VRLGTPIEGSVKKAVGLLSGPASETIARALEQSYTSGETYGSAFGKLFARLFAGQGLILLDPLDARLHRIAAPLYRKAIESRDELNEKLLQRGANLERAGYDVQVKVTAKSTLLFTMRDGVRQPVAASNSHFKSGRRYVDARRGIAIGGCVAGTFSANALFRPVVQELSLPTVAYLGGPAEIAYYAQSSVIYEHLLGRMPVILRELDSRFWMRRRRSFCRSTAFVSRIFGPARRSCGGSWNRFRCDGAVREFRS